MSEVVSIGDVVASKYRVDRILGIGGMGVVAAATHLELDQRVALKFMLPAAMAAPNAVERFLREARAAVRLRSEHVCRVLDVGRMDGGVPYIVMEYMEGQDFARLLDKGALPVRDAIDYMLQVLEGMADAHNNGIVHRDLKPGNIFVATDTDGTPLLKVLDFGISKSTVGGAATKTGDIMGSPSYMAPEQMTSSKHVDARADIWALGAILYETLSGKQPFEGDTLPALCMAVMNEPAPPLAQVRPELPPPLAAAVMRCLDKSPDKRFADVGELASALAPFGSVGSEAAANRIAKVLGRRLTPPPREVGYDATVAPSSPPSPSPAAATPVLVDRGGAGTLTSSASQVVSSTQPAARSRVPMVLGGIVVVAGAFAAVLFALRPPPKPPQAAPSREPAPPGPTPVVVPVQPPPPTVTIAPDPKIAAARAHLGSVVTAFVRWSAAHPTAPCPSPQDLAKLVPGGIKDPWQRDISITCTEQPEDQAMGVVSLGPDGVRSADDIASWMLGSDVTGLIAGPRWSGTRTATGSARPRPRPPTPVTTPASGSATAAAGSAAPVTPTPPTPKPPDPEPAPGTRFGSDGLPIGRTAK